MEHMCRSAPSVSYQLELANPDGFPYLSQAHEADHRIGAGLRHLGEAGLGTHQEHICAPRNGACHLTITSEFAVSAQSARDAEKRQTMQCLDTIEEQAHTEPAGRAPIEPSEAMVVRSPTWFAQVTSGICAHDIVIQAQVSLACVQDVPRTFPPKSSIIFLVLSLPRFNPAPPPTCSQVGRDPMTTSAHISFCIENNRQFEQRAEM